MVSLDGYIAGPNGELDWHIVDADFTNYAKKMLEDADMFLFGRITYEMMAAYWPTDHAKNDDPAIADKMNSLNKIVFSKTLEKVEWENTEIIKDDIKNRMLELKQQPGKDMVILGSGSIVSTFTQMGLIDEYRVIINPVILGSGKFQFTSAIGRKLLNLIDVKQLDSGVLILYYQPK